MPSAEPDDAAAAAAARRGRKGAPASTLSPAPDPLPVTPVEPPPGEISVPRSVVAEHVLRTDGIRAFGDPTNYTAILGPGAATPMGGDYVTASCDAYETMIPERATTSVERLLWRRGWKIRADVHARVMEAHAAAVAAGAVGVPQPASLDVDGVEPVPPMPGEIVVPPTGYVGAPAHG